MYLMGAHSVAKVLIVVSVLTLISSIGHSESDPSGTGSGSCSVDDRLVNLAEQASGQVNSLGSGAASIGPALQAWEKKRQTCKESNSKAQNECFEACSASAQKGLKGSQALGSLMNVVVGVVTQTCGLQQQAANEAKTGYEAYSASCKSAKEQCSSACAEADKMAKDLLNQLRTICKPGDPSGCGAAANAIGNLVNQDLQNTSPYVAAKKAQCDKQFSNLLKGASDVLANLGGMMLAGKICSQDSNAASTATKACSELSQEEKMQRQDCICEISSFNPGCENAKESDEASTPSFSGSTFSADAGEASKNAETGTANALSFGGPDAGSVSSGSAGGFSPGAGGAGSRGTSSANSDAKKGRFNANIFEGESGGGGGGGWSGFGSSGSESSARAARAGVGIRGLAAERKDPSFTGGGGRDNFQKIKTRYIDNSPTYLPE